ncbi:erv26 super protein [Rhodotorula kratochvilovae]
MFAGWSVLHSLSWVALAAGFVFVLLSLASGLLYVAEVIEEHSGLAKTVGKRLIYAEVVLFVLLYFVDGLPWHLVAVGIVAHINFSRNWPTISLTSATFIASCILVLASHFLSFRYFSARSASVSHNNRYTHYNAYDSRRGRPASGASGESFLDVATYFAVCVWLVPFYLFLSLSANDNVLPSAGETPNPSRRPSAAAGANPPSPTISVSKPAASPGSPSLGRHQRQRSSMMKTALSSAFGLIPSALRPSTLSAQLPLSDKAGAPRRDIPRSPSPTYSFQPYSPHVQGSASGFSSSAGVAASQAQKARPQPLLRTSSSALSPPSGGGGGWGAGAGSNPSSPTVDGLGFTAALMHASGSALASPSLGPRGGVGGGRFPPSASGAATQPSSPANARFPPGQGQGAYAAAVAPGMARRNTTDRQGVPPPSPGSAFFAQGQRGAPPQAPSPGMGALGRRASEAVLRPGVGGAQGGAGTPPVLRRGTTDGYAGGAA